MTAGDELFSGFGTILTTGKIERLLQVFCSMIKVYDFKTFREFLGQVSLVVFNRVSNFDKRPDVILDGEVECDEVYHP